MVGIVLSHLRLAFDMGCGYEGDILVASGFYHQSETASFSLYLSLPGTRMLLLLFEKYLGHHGGSLC
jgi:hypothetical protein